MNILVTSEKGLKCVSCGLCCFFKDDDGKLAKCPMLVVKDKLFLCRIWRSPERLGHKIYKKKDGSWIVCNRRDDVKLNYPGCDYNKEGNPDFEDVYQIKLPKRSL